MVPGNALVFLISVVQTPEPPFLLCRASIQMSRAGSSFLDDDLLEATAQAAGMAVKERKSGTVSPGLPAGNRDPPAYARDPPASAKEDARAPTLTMEDSAELQPYRVPARAAQLHEGQPSKPRAPAPKAKQPRCGCTIC